MGAPKQPHLVIEATLILEMLKWHNKTFRMERSTGS